MRSFRNLERFVYLKILKDRFDNSLDLVVISESWINKKNFQFYKIQGYKVVFRGREEGIFTNVLAIVDTTFDNITGLLYF